MDRWLIAGVVLLCAMPAAAQEGGSALLDRGRQLVAGLRLEAAADLPVFSALGLPQAQAMLNAVVEQGQRADATSQDWTNLHRAISGLMEIAVDRGELYRAAVLAFLQDGYYRRFEEDYGAALGAAKTGLELHRRSGVRENLAISLAAVGKDLRSLNRAAEAVAIYREAVERADDPTSRKAGEIRLDLVRAELEAGQLEDAGAEAAGFVRDSEAGRPELRPLALMGSAEVAFAQGRYDDGIGQLREAKAAGAELYELTAMVLAMVLETMQRTSPEETARVAGLVAGKFPELPVPVDQFTEQALRVRRRLAGEVGPILREQVGMLGAARAKQDKAGEAAVLQEMAATYRAANSLRSELAALREAVELQETPLGLVLLGEAQLQAGETGAASRSFTGAIRSVEAKTAAERSRYGRELARAWMGRAVAAAKDDDADGARSILRRALAGNPAGARFSKGEVFLELGRVERVDRRAREAIAAYRSAVGAFGLNRDVTGEVVARLELARALVDSNDSEAAEQVAAARTLAGRVGAAESLWRCDYVAGLLAESAGEQDAARRYYEEAARGVERISHGLGAAEQQRSIADAEAVQDIQRRLLGLTESWEALEGSKAQVFRMAMRARRFAGRAQAAQDSELRAIEARIAGLRTAMAAGNAELLRSAGRTPEALGTQVRLLEEKFALRVQESSAGVGRPGHEDAAPLSRIQKLLPAGTALVEYGITNDALVTFVVTRGSVVQVKNDVKPAVLRSAVARLRSLLADPGSTTELPGELRRVSGMVWGPVAAKVPAEVKRLLVVPAGPLYFVPFAVLEAEGEALIGKYEIGYLPGASLLAMLPAKYRKSGDVFVGALGNTSVEGMAPLPGTLEEAKAIGALYGKPVVSGTAFTHDEVKAALEQHEVVHLATHGIGERSPLFSSVLTAPTGGGLSRLSVYELAEMRLKARVVVLSACETGLGELTGGDEVTGLTRALLLAGTEHVVSSLWKVSDNSTAMLMRELHGRMRGGATPSAALRAGALAVRAKYPHPFYWAAFVETGAN